MNIIRYNSSLVLCTVTLLLLPFAATDIRGQEEVEALLAPGAEMVVASDNHLLRYRPEMSH